MASSVRLSVRDEAIASSVHPINSSHLIKKSSAESDIYTLGDMSRLARHLCAKYMSPVSREIPPSTERSLLKVTTDSKTQLKTGVGFM